jgi:subtilisin family serine protease
MYTKRIAVAAIVFTLAPAVSAGASSGTVASDVANYLAAYPGSHIVADDSSSTACMGVAHPQPLAYRADRIVLQTTLTPTAAKKLVNHTLTTHGRPDVRAVAVERITFPQPPSGPSIAPVLSITLSTSSDNPIPVVDLARFLHGQGTTASPDYALSPTSGPIGMWPSGPPLPADPSDLPLPRSNGGPPIGSGVTVWLYDTGQAPLSQSNPSPNISRLASTDVETVDGNNDGIADLYFTGHSTAIGGVLEEIAPGAVVKLAKITEADGIATDVSAARRMAASLKKANSMSAWPDLIVEPFGSPACDLDPAHPGGELVPLGLAAISDAIDRIGQAMEVASAGNRGERRKFYPAAFGSVLSVGALDATVDADGNELSSASRSGPPASFSNFGHWVKAWAPGVDLVTNHVRTLKFEVDGPVINGYAFVSGTSFAAPYVAGLVAQQMQTTGDDVQTAWDSVAATGVACSAAIGSGVAVTLTAVSDSPTDPPAPGSKPAC